MLSHNNYDMEYRPISLVLSYAPIGLIRATKPFVDLDSICVDTGCIALNDNSEVDILISIQRGERAEKHRIRAEVCGRNEHGIRLRFRDCARATLDALMPYITRH